MDYHSLPRKQLQVLCKKHGIPANAANSEMADALTALLKPKPQLHAGNSKQPEKRATRSREPALGGTGSKSKDMEEILNMKLQKATNSSKILEEQPNSKPQRVTRGRGSTCAVFEAPESAAAKTEKTPMNGEKQTNSAAIEQETKKVSIRNGASKRSKEMPTNAEERVDLKVASPTSDKKKEKAGGIVLRRGRVKVRSPVKLAKSPEVAVTAKDKGVGMPCSQSCLVDAKKAKKKKRSVTFSDILEINSASIEHPSRGSVSENTKEPAEETMPEIQQGDSNLPKNINSACMARKVVGTRKASRSVLTDVIISQAEQQIGSKEPGTKESKAEGLLASDAKKTANIEIGRELDKKRKARGKRVLSSAGKEASKQNEDENFADGFVKADHIEDVPCTRRSRRLTIVPSDVKSSHDMQKATEHLKGQKDQHECVSIAHNKIESALPAETSRRSRRKTLASLDMNHVQSSLGSASEQMEKRVSKAKHIQNTSFKSELKGEAPESRQKLSELGTINSGPTASEAEVQPIKMKEDVSARNLRGSRQKVLLASTQQFTTSAKEVSYEMGCENIGSKEIIPAKAGENVDTTESEKAHSKAPLSASILANSEPHSLQELSNNAKLEVDMEMTTSVMPRSTRESSEVSTPLDNGNAASQEPVFNIQPNSEIQEGLVIGDKAVNYSIQASEYFDFIGQSCDGQSLEEQIVKNTNDPRVEDPVISTPSSDDTSCTNGFLSAFIETGKGDEGNNQVSEDVIPIPFNEELGFNTCSMEVKTSSTTAIHCATGDSSPLVGTDSIELDAAAVKCRKFTEEALSPSPSKCAQPRHEFIFVKDHGVKEQEGHFPDELATIISLEKDIEEKSGSNSPVSTMMQDDSSLDGNHHMSGSDIEISLGIDTDEGITASSTAAIVKSPFKHQNSIAIATAEQDFCTFQEDSLTSDKDEIGNMTTEGAADLVEQQPNQAVDDVLEKVEMKIYGGGDLQQEQLQDTNEGVPRDEGDGADDGNMTDNQLGQFSLLLPSCSAEPGIALPRESACKAKQRGPRSIYKSARKAMFSVPWEDRSLEANTIPPFNKEGSLNSLDRTEKNAEIWGSSNHEMFCDQTDSASSEGEESSATEETLSDTEVCNFNTEELISNTEGDYSYSEDDTSSESEKDTMFDSEDYFSEMEGELLSGEECYASEELDISTEELSDSEDDGGDDFEEHNASPVSQLVATLKSVDDQFVTDGLVNQEVEIMAASESSLPNDGVTQAEKIDHLVFEKVTNDCAPNVQPTEIDEKIGGQHEESQKTLSTHAAIEIKENDKIPMSYNDYTVMERDPTCLDESDSLNSLASLFASPPSEVKEDVMRSLALESNVYQKSRTLETELNILPESGQSLQLCLTYKLSCEDVIPDIEKHTVDGAKKETEFCEPVDGVEKEPEINVQMVEQVQNCSLEEMAKTLSTDATTDTQENGDVLMSYNDNTGIEGVQLTANSTYQDCDLLTSSSVDNTPSKVKEDVEVGILESNVSQQSGTVETELNILPDSGQEKMESIQLGFSCELSHEDVIAKVQQLTLDGAKQETELCESVCGVEELEMNGQMGDPIQNCSKENSIPRLAVVDCFMAVSTLHNVEKSPSIGILASYVSQKSGTLERELNILPGSGQEESIQLSFPCELSHQGVIAEVQQITMDGAKHETELCESVGAVEELEISSQMGELIQNYFKQNSVAGPAVVDCFMTSPMLHNVERSHLLESNSKSAFLNSEENEQSPSESIKNLDISPKRDVQEVQEEPVSLTIDQDVFCGVEQDNAGNVEVKNDLENEEGSVGTPFDAQNGFEDLKELSDLKEGTTSELIEEFMISEGATFEPSRHAVNDTETATEPLQILYLDNDSRVDDLIQKQNNEDALAFDMANTAIGTSNSVTSIDFVKELELDMVTAEDKIRLFSTDTLCNLLEEGGPSLQLDCQQDLLLSDACKQSKMETIEGKEPRVIQSESNTESFVSQVMASLTGEIDYCSTPKCSKDLETVRVFNHESLNEVAQAMHCVEFESLDLQVEDVHEKSLGESQSSGDSTQNKETAVAHSSISEISKEQSMKQIDLTLVSLRELKKMCKENPMSAKKKTENETPSARKPSKYVHQPNTATHHRDIPSAVKRSALKALSSNIKATPAAAMQTPTAKGSQRPRNLISTYDSNDGTGKQLVTPSPQASMSSKRDFVRSHHR